MLKKRYSLYTIPVHILCPSRYKHAFMKMGPFPGVCPLGLKARAARQALGPVELYFRHPFALVWLLLRASPLAPEHCLKSQLPCLIKIDYWVRSWIIKEGGGESEGLAELHDFHIDSLPHDELKKIVPLKVGLDGFIFLFNHKLWTFKVSLKECVYFPCRTWNLLY